MYVAPACVRACVSSCGVRARRVGGREGVLALESTRVSPALDLLEPAVQLQLLVLRNLLEPIVRARRREVRGRLEVFLQSHFLAPLGPRQVRPPDTIVVKYLLENLEKPFVWDRGHMQKTVAPGSS
jgi:hypothetical protein